ncbi:MAG: GLPGLI family protein [Capnocytophaga sp.]|nr:GLPGLI family protein [Capnocytophaga sp.]
MKLFTFIALLLTITIQAQTNIWYDITYKVDIDFGMPAEKKSKLVFNTTEAYYTEESPMPKSSDNDDRKVTIQGMATRGIEEVFVTDLKNKKFIVKHKINNVFYWVEDKLFPIEWKIDRKAKATILGYQCFKAMGVFRGRQYTAWFTEDIPTKFGPWKLNGLLGLVLEVSDAVGEVSFAVERIEQLKNLDAKIFNLTDNQSDYKKVTLQEYVAIQKKNKSEIFRVHIAKLPRNAKVTEIKENDQNSGYELKYEWEK